MLTLAILSSIPDHRRGQGRLFDLPRVLLCSILAVLAGANSYRSVYRFIDVRWDWLRQYAGLNWRRKPCYTALYTILRGIDAAALEQALRQQAAQLTAPTKDEGLCAIALDGKTLRGSLDQAAQTPAVAMAVRLPPSRSLGAGTAQLAGWRQEPRNRSGAATHRSVGVAWSAVHVGCLALPKKHCRLLKKAAVTCRCRSSATNPSATSSCWSGAARHAGCGPPQPHRTAPDARLVPTRGRVAGRRVLVAHADLCGTQRGTFRRSPSAMATKPGCRLVCLHPAIEGGASQSAGTRPLGH